MTREQSLKKLVLESLRSKAGSNFIFMWICGAGATACGLIFSYLVKEFIDAMPTGEVLSILGFTIGVYMLQVALRRTEGYLFMLARPPLRAAIREKYFAKLRHLHLGSLSAESGGTLAHHINDIGLQVANLFMLISFYLVPAITTLIGTTLLLSTVHIGLVPFIGCWTLLSLSLTFAQAQKCFSLSKPYAAARGKVAGETVDTLNNIRPILLTNSFHSELSRYQQFSENEVASAKAVYRFVERLRLIQEVSAALLVIALLISCLLLSRSGGCTAGEIAMITTLGLLLVDELKNITMRFPELLEILGSIHKSQELLSELREIPATPNNITVKRGLIEFENVTFRHRKEQALLEGFSLTIRPGERVGIVGPSGSGKSTLISLLLQANAPSNGRIRVDGSEISNISSESLRSQIAYVPQEPTLLQRSIRENILLGNQECSELELLQACSDAELIDIIKELPDGLLSEVGSGGLKLSGGQRQRVALARAILRQAPILILDEATSALDYRTEQKVYQNLMKRLKNTTVIMVAHRLSTVKELDRIIVIDSGKIVEQGTHEELVKKKGLYEVMSKLAA